MSSSSTSPQSHGVCTSWRDISNVPSWFRCDLDKCSDRVQIGFRCPRETEVPMTTSIQGTLTISGDIDRIGEAANLLVATFPDGLEVTVDIGDLEWCGYTVDRALALLRRLAKRQRMALSVVVEHDGFAKSAVLREVLGNDRGQIRGLTGPISKHVLNLIGEGVLPAGTKPPTTTAYDPDSASYQRAGGIAMAPELVPIFRAALQR